MSPDELLVQTATSLSTVEAWVSGESQTSPLIHNWQKLRGPKIKHCLCIGSQPEPDTPWCRGTAHGQDGRMVENVTAVSQSWLPFAKMPPPDFLNEKTGGLAANRDRLLQSSASLLPESTHFFLLHRSTLHSICTHLLLAVLCRCTHLVNAREHIYPQTCVLCEYVLLGRLSVCQYVSGSGIV